MGCKQQKKMFDNYKKKLYICNNSGFGIQSEHKQKQVEALPLGESMKLEAQSISLCCRWVVHYTETL